jgi:hypothetical protein
MNYLVVLQFFKGADKDTYFRSEWDQFIIFLSKNIQPLLLKVALST